MITVARGEAMTSENSILLHTSFNALNEAGQWKVCELYASYLRGEKLDLDIQDLFYNRMPLAETVAVYENKLQAINPATFPFFNEAQKKALKAELLFAFYLFSAQYNLDDAESRRQNLHKLGTQIKRCADLLFMLEHSIPTLEKHLAYEINSYGLHLKYLGLTVIAPFIVKKVQELIEKDSVPLTKAKEGIEKELKEIDPDYSETGQIREWMGALNERRLYWVWGDGFLASVLSLLPADFGHRLEAEQTLGTVRHVAGYVSWILYYSRFGINLGLLLKHAIQGPWMKEKETQIPAWDRFKTQWNQRKFNLLNDSIWATVNLVTFFWLTGSSWLGYSGNLLTVGLLLVDTVLSIWRFYEESTAYNKTMLRYENDLEALNEKIRDTEAALTIDEENAMLQDKLAALTIEQEKLLADRKQTEMEWRYKKYKAAAGFAYSTGLLAGFIVMCCIMPPGVLPATALVLGVAGAAVCFALTVAYNAVTSALDIGQIAQQRQLLKQERQKLVDEFLKSNDPDEKKFLYLEIMRLDAESSYQGKKIAFQTAQLIRSIFIDAMMPVLIFTALTFMPTGIGIGVIAAGLALAVISRLILNQFEPGKAKAPEFDEAAYESFARELPKQHRQTAGTFGLFARPREEQPLLQQRHGEESSDDEQLNFTQ